MPDAEIIRPPEVSQLLNTPVETLRYWRGKGVGPKFFRVGRRVFYRRRDILDWIDSQETVDGTDGAA